MSPAVTLRRPGWSASCIALAARAQTAPSPCVAATDSNTPATPEASTAARSAPACAENNVLDLRAQLLQPPRAATQNQTWRALIRAAAAAAAAHRAIPRRGGLDPCRRTSCQGRPRAREKPRAASEIRRRPGCRALQPLRRATGFMNRYRMGARRTPFGRSTAPIPQKGTELRITEPPLHCCMSWSSHRGSKCWRAPTRPTSGRPTTRSRARAAAARARRGAISWACSPLCATTCMPREQATHHRAYGGPDMVTTPLRQAHR